MLGPSRSQMGAGLAAFLPVLRASLSPDRSVELESGPALTCSRRSLLSGHSGLPAVGTSLWLPPKAYSCQGLSPLASETNLIHLHLPTVPGFPPQAQGVPTIFGFFIFRSVCSGLKPLVEGPRVSSCSLKSPVPLALCVSAQWPWILVCN